MQSVMEAKEEEQKILKMERKEKGGVVSEGSEQKKADKFNLQCTPLLTTMKFH